jgi:membrane-associated phospholipid phosphatase
MKRPAVFILLFAALTVPFDSFAQDPFVARKPRETAIIAGGAAVLVLGTLAYVRPSPAFLANPDRNRIFAPDRFAVDLSSKSAAAASDLLMDAGIGFPLLFFSRKTIATDVLMFAESNLLCQGITQLCKGVFQRPRPYAYRPEYAGKPLGRDAFRSFISGHTSAAFNGAVLAAVVYGKRHPGSKGSRTVWVTGLTLAAATGTCRVLAGRHFPTDVLAGAAVGALTGWLIPQLHLGGGR